MSRTFRIAVLLWSAFILCVLLLLVTHATATSPSRWQPLGQRAFQSVPAVPGSAGSIPTVAPSPAGWAAQMTSGWEPSDGWGRVPVSPVVVSPQPSTPPSSPSPTIRAPRTYLSGVATFYQFAPGGAAAAVALRKAIGPMWRHTRVRVCSGQRCVVVVLSDYESSLIPGRVIDLNEQSFAELAGPGWYQRGVLAVTVSWGVK